MKKNNEQMIFDLSRPGNIGLENFFISDANTLAVEAIKNWKTWPGRRLILLGGTGSGKSHLADFWAGESNGRKITIFDLVECDVIELSQSPALIIDDIDIIKPYSQVNRERVEEKLFHLVNSVAQTSCYLMMTSSAPVSLWGVQLPDLLSRLSSMAIVELFPPDDQLLMAVLLKQFDDRQITVSPEFVMFVLKRINRTYESIREFVESIDQLALRQKQEVTIPIAAKILDSLDKNISKKIDVNSLGSSLEGVR